MSIANIVPLTFAFPRVPQPKRWSVAEFHALCGEKQYEGHRGLIVFRDRAADPAQLFGAAYRSRTVLDANATISPLAAPRSQIRVADLLP